MVSPMTAPKSESKPLDLRSPWQKQRDALVAGKDPNAVDDESEDGGEGADEAAAPPTPKRVLVKRVLAFKIECFDYDNPSDPDAILAGTIVSKVPDGPEHTKIAHQVARFCAGLPWDSIPPGDRRRFTFLATCMHQIQDAPDWLMGRLAEDFDVLTLVYGRLVEHQAMFRLRGRSLEESQSGSGLPMGVVIGPLAPLPSALQRRGA